MSWKSYDKQMDRGPISAIAVNWRIGLFVLLLCGLTTCGVAVVTKPFDILSGTLDSENVKTNYEWFKTQYQSILALEVQVDQAQDLVVELKAELGPRDKWHREDREEYARLRSIVLGLQAARASQASDYNARSMMVNRAIFKGTDTPTAILMEPK